MSSPFPKTIKRIGVVAPAGPCNKQTATNSIELLEQQGLEVVLMPHLFSGTSEPYLSSSIENRIADLEQCWSDNSIDLILCLRGGYGSAELLPHINWELLKKRDVPFLGFSDITALHLGMIKNRLSSPIAAPTLSLFKEAITCTMTTNSLKNSIFSKNKKISTHIYPTLNIIKQGECTAPLFPLNLTVLTTLIGTPYLPDFSNTILLLEDIGEAPYAVDRHLNHLLQAGILTSLKGVIFGQFTDRKKHNLNSQYTTIFQKYSTFINGPVIANFPFGHTLPMETVPYGISTHITTKQ
jgi:muramoyltetrapeptide carboxypeptidase